MLAELYVLNGRDVGKVLDATSGPVIFMGRAASNTLRIRDPQASRVHCRIDVTTDRLTLQDAKSGNGTFINGDRVDGERPLADGDTISIGNTKIKVLIETPEDRAELERRRGRPSDLGESSGSFETSESETVPPPATVIGVSRAPAEDAVAALAATDPQSDAKDSLAATSVEGFEASETASAASRKRGVDDRAVPKLREVIPGFRLEARLGGHSRQGVAVYRAQQASLERPVALKVFLPRGGTSEADVKRFLREAKAVARLPHPHIVTIHDVITQGRMHAIVMEFLAGGSLRDQLDDGPLELKQVLRLAAPIASALHYLHAHGVVHRALKPSNLLLAREHRAYKLANFATATGLQGQRYGDTSYLSAPMDGFAYLAPEQLGSDTSRVCAATDVYGLGACLLSALTGQPPFVGASVPALAASILRDPPPEPPSNTPKQLREVIARCLEKEPEARFANGGELLRALQVPRGSRA